MGIVITDIILFVFFIFVGIDSGSVLAGIIIGLFVITLTTILLADAEWKCNTKEGQEQFRRDQEREKKEWEEWRYRQDDDK